MIQVNSLIRKFHCYTIFFRCADRAKLGWVRSPFWEPEPVLCVGVGNSRPATILTRFLCFCFSTVSDCLGPWGKDHTSTQDGGVSGKVLSLHLGLSIRGSRVFWRANRSITHPERPSLNKVQLHQLADNEFEFWMSHREIYLSQRLWITYTAWWRRWWMACSAEWWYPLGRNVKTTAPNRTTFGMLVVTLLLFFDSDSFGLGFWVGSSGFTIFDFL